MTSKLIRIASTGAVVGAVVAMLAGPASSHELDTTALTCSSVVGTFHDFGAHDHPIVWHVQVGAVAPSLVATVESPAAFVGSGTATADISVLTATLNGVAGTVRAFATWPGGQSVAQSAQLTCGVSTQVGGIETQAPTAAPASAPSALPATAVPAAANFTG